MNIQLRSPHARAMHDQQVHEDVRCKSLIDRRKGQDRLGGLGTRTGHSPSWFIIVLREGRSYLMLRRAQLTIGADEGAQRGDIPNGLAERNIGIGENDLESVFFSDWGTTIDFLWHLPDDPMHQL
jgi:hypothetical protein